MRCVVRAEDYFAIEHRIRGACLEACAWCTNRIFIAGENTDHRHIRIRNHDDRIYSTVDARAARYIIGYYHLLATHMTVVGIVRKDRRGFIWNPRMRGKADGVSADITCAVGKCQYHMTRWDRVYLSHK